MSTSDAQIKIQQSRNITRIGCIGAVLVLILLVLIGAVTIRSDLSKKRAEAVNARERMKDQIDKAPGVLRNLLCESNCTDLAKEIIEDIADKADDLDRNPKCSKIDDAWDMVETAAELIRNCCGSEHVDDNDDLQGIRNRYYTERAKFKDKVGIYNSAQKSLTAKLVGWEYEEL